MTEKPTATDVAHYMEQQLKAEKYLYQETVVYKIETKFGKRGVVQEGAV